MCTEGMLEIEPHECDKCGKDCETLYSKGPYNNNKENGSFCTECFEIVFNEPAED